jgi:pimeloyl-ACP methyl ester carboxylesterase
MDTTGTHTSIRGAAWRLGLLVALVSLAGSVTAAESQPVTAATVTATSVTAGTVATGNPLRHSRARARIWKIRYTASNGAKRHAYVVLPASYGPRRNPPLPLVISPHGRGGNGHANALLWGNLPAVGGFAVVNPDGMGRVLPRYSFAYRGQIDDLARMPSFVTRALPWVRIDRRRIFALGSSMGGQETLMLVARYPHLLAGAAAMDSVTDLVRRYAQMPDVPCNSRCVQRFGEPYGRVLQANIVSEIGSKPAGDPRAWAARSPLAHAKAIAGSGVPLQIWWSRKDKIVVDQAHQSRRLFAALRHVNPHAQVSAYVGSWRHSCEMRYSALLPIALADFGLLPAHSIPLPAGVDHLRVPKA